jgi:hypothetical protein
VQGLHIKDVQVQPLCIAHRSDVQSLSWMEVSGFECVTIFLDKLGTIKNYAHLERFVNGEI